MSLCHHRNRPYRERERTRLRFRFLIFRNSKKDGKRKRVRSRSRLKQLTPVFVHKCLFYSLTPLKSAPEPGKFTY